MASFGRAYQRLNAAQRAAVDAIEGPVLVLAGPGTGKTQLLSLRVANILRQTDVSASNILCLTFTESGQLAMQQRLIELIGPAADKIAVHTFHGFGTAIIANNPGAFFDGQTFRPADDLRLFEIFYDLFENLPHRHPLARRAYGEFIYLKDSQTRISQLKAAGLTPADLRQIIKADQSWCQPAQKLIAKTYGQFDRVSKAQLPLFEKLLGQLQKLPIPASPIDWWQPLAVSCINDLAEALELSQASGKTTALTTWKKQWLNGPASQPQLRAIGQYTKLTALADVYEDYLAALRQRHLFDYDDMILEVLLALDRKPELLATLQEQYQYILVDEYQDTNGAQARLIERLADNPVHEGRPNLMVVGDDDQAIYGFQGAQAGVLLQFRERWREVQTITLTENYRSNQAILDAIRQLILQGEKRLENYYEDVNKQLRAAGRGGGAGVKYWLSPDEASQLTWLAKQIQQRLNAGQPPESIVILAPRHKYLERMLPIMSDIGIEVRYERRQNILDQPELQQLLLLARACQLLAQPALKPFENLLPELFSYPFWGIKPEAIWRLAFSARRQQQSWLEALATTSDRQLQSAWQWLNDSVPLVQQPLEVALPVLLELLEKQHAQPALRHSLDVLLYHLRNYAPDQNLRLGDLVRYASLCQQAGIYLSEQLGEVTQPTQVQLMTAHKAKGLEFDTVFIINATEPVWLTEPGARNKLALPPNLTIQPPGESADDRLRLFYVAGSRAKKELIFSSYQQSSTGKTVTALGWLSGTDLQSQTIQPSKSGKTLAAGTTIFKPAEQPDWRDAHWQTLARPSAQKLLRQRLPGYCLSPTHLLSFLDVSHGGPKQFLVDHLLAFPRSLPVDAVFGQVIHSTLDYTLKFYQSEQQLPSEKAINKQFDKQLRAARLAEVDEERLRQRGHEALAQYIKEKGDELKVPQLSEQTLITQSATQDGWRLTGRLDRLVFDEPRRTATVIDYKTGKSFGRWQANSDYDKLKLHFFKLQLQFYKLLVETATLSPDYKLINGQIEFVEADANDQLHSLIYEFNLTDQQRLRQLIVAVWQHIIDLQLPDTTNYPASYAGVLAFEDDLLNGRV